MTHRIVPAEPTEEMLNKARDWSLVKYGQGIGNDAATGCYRAMLSAAPPFEWPEEAVAAACRKVYGQEWSFLDVEVMKAALNAALKVLEGRDE